MGTVVFEKGIDIARIAADENRRIASYRKGNLALRLADRVQFALVSATFTTLSLLVNIALPKNLSLTISRTRVLQTLNNAAIRWIDILGAFVGLVFSIPLFLIVPILIKLDSPGPVFYRQLRTGINRRKGERRHANLGIGIDRRMQQRRKHNLFGRPFVIYKFRTMHVGAEKESGPVWAREDDPRITRIGKYLRKFHIDEIPQFWNILKGEMSLVGPRPERPEIIRKLVEEIPDYQARLSVRPGLTGPAQIFNGYDTNLEDVRRKLQYDLEYLQKRGPVYHLQMIFLTLARLLTNFPNNETG
ncbi:MAG: sugar transferase [candidate division KSB1 bacterium]|nr:sugar transferase [candidate division KSB1 bacterium]